MSSAADPSEYPPDEQQPKEIFFKEINFSPDLTIRMDYQVNCENIKILMFTNNLQAIKFIFFRENELKRVIMVLCLALLLDLASLIAVRSHSSVTSTKMGKKLDLYLTPIDHMIWPQILLFAEF